MIINITHKTTIRDVQRKIATEYPFVKIEFAVKQKFHRSKSSAKDWYDHDCKLLSIAKKPEKGWVVVHSWHKTFYLKQTFEERFGLHIEVLRRQNDQWVETSGTDIFTLDEQNEKGRKSVEKNFAPFYRERELLL